MTQENKLLTHMMDASKDRVSDTPAYDRNLVADLMALVDTYADTSTTNGIRSPWAQMARAAVESELMNERRTTAAQLQTARAAAMEEAAKDKADAARYRWLRENKFGMRRADMDGPACPRLNTFLFDLWAEKPETHNKAGLDAAIDAAMGKEPS